MTALTSLFSLVALTLTASAAAQLGPTSVGRAGPQNPRGGYRALGAYEPRTLAVRSEAGQGSVDDQGWIETRAHTYVRIPKMAASVVVAEDDTNLAITFTAEAYVSGPPGTRLFVRAKIDGELANPDDVVLTMSGLEGTRCFIFTEVFFPLID